MPEIPPGTPFKGHVAVLNDRREYLARMMEEEPGSPIYHFWKDEKKALDWAIEVLSGSLTFPPDVEEMRRAWAQRNRLNHEFNKEFAQFLDYLEWSQERAAKERRWEDLA